MDSDIERGGGGSEGRERNKLVPKGPVAREEDRWGG